MLQRSLLSLPKRKHVAVLSKFAQFEFKYGSSERGRTMFDSLMATCPKRLDLWSVWLDMEEGHGDEGAGRRLYERVCAMKWSSKKMRFLLKRLPHRCESRSVPTRLLENERKSFRIPIVILQLSL